MFDSSEIDVIFDDPEARKYSFYRLYYSARRSRSELAAMSLELTRANAKLSRQAEDLAGMEASISTALLAIPEAKKQVRNHFSYRLGNAITRIRSIVGLVKLPWTILLERRIHRSQLSSRDEARRPLTDFGGGQSHLADKIARYASVRAGRNDLVRVAGRVIFSGGDPHQSVHLLVRNLDAQSGADEVVPIVVREGEFSIEFAGRENDVAVTFLASGEYPALIKVRTVEINPATMEDRSVSL